MDDGIKVGQLWRRRLDGRRFIPAKRVNGCWLDLAGIKRTATQLREDYVRIRLDDVDAEPEANGR